MLEDLLKAEVKRFEEATLAYPATPKLSTLGNYPTMPHVLKFSANESTPTRGERLVRLTAVASSGLKPLAERTVVFHYTTTRGEGGEFVNYPGQDLRPDDVANLRAAVDELIELSKNAQRS